MGYFGNKGNVKKAVRDDFYMIWQNIKLVDTYHTHSTRLYPPNTTSMAEAVALAAALLAPHV